MAEAHSHHHPHPKQPDLEDSPLTHYQAMTFAVMELLQDKQIISPEEVRKMIEMIDSRSPATGAKLVAKAWTDPEFKAKLLDNVNKAAAELDIDAGHIEIRAVENTDDTHNLIVCTLCSCYPRLLIGLPPDWYKSRAYRSRAVSEPRAVIAEFGTQIPDDVKVVVHDSTADLRYMVLPARPAGTEGMDEEALAELVTRDCMVGTALPQSPST